MGWQPASGLATCQWAGNLSVGTVRKADTNLVRGGSYVWDGGPSRTGRPSLPLEEVAPVRGLEFVWFGFYKYFAPTALRSAEGAGFNRKWVQGSAVNKTE